MVQKSAYTDTEVHTDECVLASSGRSNKANIFVGLIEYELNSPLNDVFGALHIVGYNIGSYSIRPRKIFAEYQESIFRLLIILLLLTDLGFA